MYKQSISSDEAACQAHLHAKNTSPTSLWRKKLAREAKIVSQYSMVHNASKTNK